MANTSIDPVALFGTAEPVEPIRLLHAGALTAELDSGNIRHIKVGSVEVIRAISFIVRDRHWGTFSPRIEDLAIEENGDTFSVRYRAEVDSNGQRFGYKVMIDGRARQITFAAEGETPTGFETCRTGFVVLHPVTGVAGAPVTIEHVDGRTVEGGFPDLIDPIQPMMDLRALTHEAAPGLRVTCRMEGEAFEMEDQRNWCDASYKTYVRPLSKPWPYTIPAGEVVRQSVTLDIAGEAPRTAGETRVGKIGIGAPVGPSPRIGLGFDPTQAEATRRVLSHLQALKPDILVCHYDARAGHSKADLQAGVAIAHDLGAEPWLEAVIGDVVSYEAEIQRLAALVQGLGSPFVAVHLSPAPDLKSTTPGQPWPEAPLPDRFYAAVRASFPGARIGGGMISTFTELNRKRPPLDNIDFVAFTTVAIIHASDDVSVIEGLEALPAIARSAEAIAGGRPVVVGPSAIGLRLNPYGAAPVANPDNVRRAMVGNDPRQRGWLGAAWAVGYVAHLAHAGVEAVVLGSTTGPHGAVHTRQAWPTPGFEQDGEPYPVFHVLEWLTALKGGRSIALDISEPSLVQGVAVERDGATYLLLANLTGELRDVELSRPGQALAVIGPGQTSWTHVGGAGMRAALAPYGLAKMTL